MKLQIKEKWRKSLSEQLLYDQRAEEWSNTRDLPWNKIRYELTNYFIKKHIPENAKDILEIGCGNGIESLMLYQESYNFTLSDYSMEMIEQAKCIFRPKPDTDSGAKRTVIPVQSGHLFRE